MPSCRYFSAFDCPFLPPIFAVQSQSFEKYNNFKHFSINPRHCQYRHSTIIPHTVITSSNHYHLKPSLSVIIIIHHQSSAIAYDCQSLSSINKIMHTYVSTTGIHYCDRCHSGLQFSHNARICNVSSFPLGLEAQSP